MQLKSCKSSHWPNENLKDLRKVIWILTSTFLYLKFIEKLLDVGLRLVIEAIDELISMRWVWDWWLLMKLEEERVCTERFKPFFLKVLKYLWTRHWSAITAGVTSWCISDLYIHYHIDGNSNNLGMEGRSFMTCFDSRILLGIYG